LTNSQPRPVVLVTGGAGYIGSHFVHRYLGSNPDAKVLVVDDLSTGHRESLGELPVVFEHCNIGDYETMIRLLRQHAVESVVHFAANAYVGESEQRPNKYFHNNVVNSLNLFRAMEDTAVRKIVFSSTCATYGNPQYLPIDELHPQKPINIYGLTKKIVEEALAGYARTAGWTFIALRYFNASGAAEHAEIGESHQPETHLVPLVLQAAAGEIPQIEVFGDDYDTEDGTCIRDYVHVNDLADAHCLALSRLNEMSGGDAINLGTTYGASVKTVLQVAEEVTGLKIAYRISKRRSGDPDRLVADASKALAVLQWKPLHDLHSIVETAWRWQQSKSF